MEEKYLKEVFKGIIYHTTSLIWSKVLMLGISKDIQWDPKMVIVDDEDHYLIAIGTLCQMQISLIENYICSKWVLTFFLEESFFFLK